jgi:hypothetical protein
VTIEDAGATAGPADRWAAYAWRLLTYVFPLRDLAAFPATASPVLTSTAQTDVTIGIRQATSTRSAGSGTRSYSDYSLAEQHRQPTRSSPVLALLRYPQLLSHVFWQINKMNRDG